MCRRVCVSLLASIVVLFSTPVLVLHQTVIADDGIIPGKYIVVLRDQVQDVDGETRRLSGKHALTRENVYHQALKGFSASMSAKEAAALANELSVAFVSPDRVIYALPSGSGKGTPVVSPPQTVPTGVQRIGIDTANTERNKGAGIGVAVLDTGIDLTHPDLQSNVVANVSFVSGTKNGNDDNGHGTHVAGTIAALNNSIGVVGVAPQAKLYAVKVLNRNGTGSWSSIIAGIDWVTKNKDRIQVANLSLGGSGAKSGQCGATTDALYKAICTARDAGVTFVVAAGNSGIDASSQVPAAYDDAVITVSAIADSDGISGGLGSATSSGADDTFASFSNFGPVVDIAAPGVNIRSTWKGGGYASISGTSMATPHVSGAAALYLARGGTPTLSAVRGALTTAGYPQGSANGFTGDPDTAHEPLLYAGGF